MHFKTFSLRNRDPAAKKKNSKYGHQKQNIDKSEEYKTN